MIPSKDSGFTFVELLVSLALMAIMAMLLASVMDFTRQNWVRSGRLQGMEQQVMARLDLRNWLQEYDRRKPFKGSKTNFEFTLWPEQQPHPDAYRYRVSLSIDRLGTTDRLNLNLIGFAPDETEIFNQTRAVASGLTQVTIRYYGRISPTAKPAWRSDWDFVTGKLRLIKIEATRQNGKPWPPFTVRVGQLTDSRVLDVSSPRPKD